MKKAETSKTKLAAASGNKRDDRAVVRAFDLLLDEQRALLTAYEDLRIQSRVLTNVVKFNLSDTGSGR